MKIKVGNPAFSSLSRLALAAAAMGSIVAAPATAKELRYAVGLPESSYNYDAAVAFSEELAETTDLDVKVFGMSLLSLNEIPGGIRDGLADLGYTLFPYFPAEFSELNLPANLSMLATSGTPATHAGPAMIGASMEYIMLNCEDCQTQLKSLNTVYLSGGAAVDYGLVCNTPVRTIEDIAGKRVRTGTPDMGRFVEFYGGTQVALSGNEIYDALSTGNVDCSTNSPENLTGLRYIEVVDSITHLMPGSMFSGLGTANINRDTWAGLTEDERRAVMEAGGRLALTAWQILKERNEAGLEAMKAEGKDVFLVSDADQAKITAFAEQDFATVVAQFTEQYGLNDVEAKAETIRELVEKWKGLTNEVEGTDIQAFSDLYVQEIYSKIDTSEYGLN
ncbi:C4-dicarboxylate TRAP transporter substrate-binding protein [Anianabacter salinae]|uniref:C4-dicarboxylate TRAP transporter substrate-binding protein n=1 Tax=Anianabacter salinae TaxID=2851023 RepID=UPI00225E2603|nr:C4-dicarboxylate TRAP transporter substrate-binding protein [Anianabacter salinae]MBV0911068.1 C4-dicarboxylate TRAP transporter substrate-binding protein [Anianabacter salinae]